MMHEGTALVVAVATGGLIALLPEVAELRKATPDSELAHDLHTGLAVGAMLVIALASVAAFAEKDPVPLMAAAVAVTAVIGGYEYVLRTDGVILKGRLG
jgi:hypothetical protein